MTPVDHDLRLCDLLRAESRAYVAVSSASAGGSLGLCNIAAHRKAFQALREARQAVDSHEAGYAGWSRFFLVTSSSGHVHSSQRCCTCHKGRQATRFALVPALSGSTEAEAVAELGPALCSVCYPSAPVEHREQATIPQAQAQALADGGVEAFRAARQASRAKASKRCPGSNQAPGSVRRNYGADIGKCVCCGSQHRTTKYGLVPAHNRPEFYVENADGKCLGPKGWGPRTKATIFATREEAVLAAPGFEGATVRAK